jgi:hypothetical protein
VARVILHTHIVKKHPETKKSHGSDLNALRPAEGAFWPPPFLFGGKGEEHKTFAMTSRIPCKRATQRTADAKPTFSTRAGMIKGNTTPPRLEPHDTIPTARPLRLENHCVASVMAGSDRPDVARPKATPWASTICQYVLQRLSMQTEKTAMAENGAKITREP